MEQMNEKERVIGEAEEGNKVAFGTVPVEYEKLDVKAKRVWRISSAIGLAVIVILSIAATIIGNMIEFENMIYVYIIAAVLFGITVIDLLIIPQIKYKQWGYFIGSDKVEIRHGIFFIKTEIIPVVRIQHISNKRGPIVRAHNLATVSISTASGHFEIPCLNQEIVEEISENLKSKLVKRLEKENA